MRYYAELLKLRCFTSADVALLTGNASSASSLLTGYRKRGYVDHVRRDLWVALGLDDHQPVASRYRIATAINADACVSHHSAFGYHGYAIQVSHEICVTSSLRFAPFKYDGVDYRWLAPRITTGIASSPDGARVTDLERTVLDAINDVEKIGGLEELLASLEALPYLEPAKLVGYLGLYGKQVLYQKTGYLLSQFNDILRLPDHFFNVCASHVGRSVRYLDQDLPTADATYDRRWQLVVPRRAPFALAQRVG